MQDRVSLYPGRVKLVPVSGQENTYDMVRADSPTQEGAPLNKATFLKDATAALYGLDETAVPDDVLALIQPVLNDLSEGILNKAKIATGSYTGTNTIGSSNPTSLTFPFIPKLVLIFGKTSASSYQKQVFFFNLEELTKDYSNPGYIYILGSQSSQSQYAYAKKADKTLSWYWGNGSDKYNQANVSGITYHWIAIG